MRAFHPIVFGYLTPRRGARDVGEPLASGRTLGGEESAPLQRPAEEQAGPAAGTQGARRMASRAGER